MRQYDPTDGSPDWVPRWATGWCRDPAGDRRVGYATGTAALYRLGTGHTVTRMVKVVTISNGLGWSPDERLMRYADVGTLFACQVAGQPAHAFLG